MLDFPASSAKSFILYNLNDARILASENPDDPLPVASLTKLMVAITILEDTDLNLSDIVTITPDMLTDLAEWSVVGLQPYQTATVEDLLYALLLPSAGDAGQALAISASGSIEAFADKMNQKASALGLKNSHFTNPIGRDEDNYSTASDIATLLFHALKNPTFRTIFSAETYDFNPLNKTIKKTTTSYGLDTDILTGSKTGFTNLAGRCLASTASLNGVDYLYVTLGHDPASADHISESLEMYNYFNDNYSYRPILEQNQPLLEIPVADAKIAKYTLIAPETATYYMENAYDLSNLEIAITHPNIINRYTNQASPLAHLTITKSADLIYETDLYLTNTIEFNNPAPLALALGTLALIPLIIITIFRKRKLKTPIKAILFIIFALSLTALIIHLINTFNLPTPETLTTML